MKIDLLSFAACLVEIHGAGSRRQSSGFFWRFVDQPYFVTNWHVVTGNHPFSGMSMDNGWSPEQLAVRYWTLPASGISVTLGPDSKALEQHSLKIDLYGSEGEALWFQHRSFSDNRCDVVAIPANATTTIKCVNDYEFVPLFNHIGCDVFVVGYPLKLQPNDESLHLPIWKRGSLATEMLFPWKFKYPAFAIDCRTSRGMSGSPVFRRVFGPATDADMTTHLQSAVTTEFIGVYSGRLDDDEGNASIGLVWRHEILDEILRYPARGTRSI